MRPHLLLAVVLCVLVAGCGSRSSDSSSQKSGGSGSSSTPAKTDKVDISDFKYKPQMIEVKAGTKVSFTNEDTAEHTATSKPQGAFDSGDISKGQTKPVTFKKAGDFKYYCVYHAFMTGTVKVVK
ncbi:MAG: cupredoxin domain-containing protein [Thermoleophilaceae bacterium]